MRITRQMRTNAVEESVYDLGAPRKPTNVSINSDLLRQAKALDINLSQALERTLVQLVREARRAQWLEENREAIDEYNARIDRAGAFSDGLRRF
jgi:antitoxin CcdA